MEFGGKNQWPELVNTNSAEAAERIRQENPNITEVVILAEGSPTTRDFRLNRVRVFENTQTHLVVSAPHVG